MTAFDYGRSKATADRLITRFGMAAALRRTPMTGPSYNPTPGTPVDHACRIVVTDYEQREIDGSRVLSTDKKALVAVGDLTVTPSVTDLLVPDGDTEYKIVDVRPLNPGGTVVMYELQVRR